MTITLSRTHAPRPSARAAERERQLRWLRTCLAAAERYGANDTELAELRGQIRALEGKRTS